MQIKVEDLFLSDFLIAIEILVKFLNNGMDVTIWELPQN